MERATRFELATPSLGSLYSTNWAMPAQWINFEAYRKNEVLSIAAQLFSDSSWTNTPLFTLCFFRPLFKRAFTCQWQFGIVTFLMKYHRKRFPFGRCRLILFYLWEGRNYIDLTKGSKLPRFALVFINHDINSHLSSFLTLNQLEIFLYDVNFTQISRNCHWNCDKNKLIYIKTSILKRRAV